MDQERLNKLISRYFANTLTDEERVELNAWYESFDGEITEVPVSDGVSEEQVMDDVFGNIQRRIHSRRRFTSMFLRIAASVSLLAIASWTVYSNYERVFNWLNPVRYAEEYVPKGQNVELTLADGTRVALRPNSRFRYPKKFNRSSREVYLDGEAFFSVAHDEEHPFKIYTGKVVTTVLGTSFNVRAPRQTDDVTVTVKTGKVRVAVLDSTEAEGKQENMLAVLLPNDQIMYNQATAVSSIMRGINPQTIAPWMRGTLEFEAITLSQMARALEEWYGVSVRIVDSTASHCTYTGSFHRMSLDRVLRQLSAANGFVYERKGQVVLIKGGVQCKDQENQEN